MVWAAAGSCGFAVWRNRHDAPCFLTSSTERQRRTAILRLPFDPPTDTVLSEMSKRRQVRERVLQALYAAELSGDGAEHIIETLINPVFGDEKTYLRFAEKLLIRGLDVQDEADELIKKHIQNWELGRLTLTDRLVLRMAIAEFLYFDDIPPKVTINEALEVAKAFSTRKSGSFVNGVLDAVLSELKENGRINKSGRGLVGMSVPSSTDG